MIAQFTIFFNFMVCAFGGVSKNPLPDPTQAHEFRFATYWELTPKELFKEAEGNYDRKMVSSRGFRCL